MQLHERVREYRRLQATNPTPERRHKYTLGGRIRQELGGAIDWANLDADIGQYANIFPPNIMILEMRDEDRLDMDMHIQHAMSERAAVWRLIVGSMPEEKRLLAPVLFAFVVYKHIVSIVTLDGDNPEAVCHIPIQLNLSEQNQNQWNALAIMATICWGRDLYADLVKELNAFAGMDDSTQKAKADESDPDA